LPKSTDPDIIRWIYQKLFRSFGAQRWWPAQTRFEVIVGAILTQGTAWGNVEKSIRTLKKAHLLNPRRMYRIPKDELARHIRSSGFLQVKAERLKAFLEYLFYRWEGSLDRMFRCPTPKLRKELLQVSGLGEETVDCILLYAGKKPVFVVDTYTQRILKRHGLLEQKATYQKTQDLFVKSLPTSPQLFNEYHALLVEVGKRFCRITPQCSGCPLDPLPRTERTYPAFWKTHRRKAA